VTRQYDAIVAGGGPAGLAAAIALGESGCRVLVCDRRTLPADKPCGEGILPTGVAELRRIGILDALPTGSSRAFEGVRYVAPSGRTAAAPFAPGPGLAVRRTALSGALLERVRRTRGVDVWAPARVKPRERTRSEVTVEVDGLTLSTPLLVGADGLHSDVRRWAGLVARPPRVRRWGARQHFAVRPWSNSVEVHFSPGVEAYVTPVSADQVGIALLWDRDRVGAVQGARLMEDLLAHFPALERRLRGATTVSAPRAVGPLMQPVRGVVAERVLLIGDAAGYVDALTGEGISLALAEARVLSGIIAPALRERRLDGDFRSALDAYARRAAEITRPHRRLTRLLLRIGRHPALLERLVSGFAAEPLALQHFVSASMGIRPVWAMAPRRLLKLVRVASRPALPKVLAPCATE